MRLKESAITPVPEHVIFCATPSARYETFSVILETVSFVCGKKDKSVQVLFFWHL